MFWDSYRAIYPPYTRTISDNPYLLYPISPLDVVSYIPNKMGNIHFISYRIIRIGLGRKFSWISRLIELFLDICSKLSSCAINPELIGVCL